MVVYYQPKMFVLFSSTWQWIRKKSQRQAFILSPTIFNLWLLEDLWKKRMRFEQKQSRCYNPESASESLSLLSNDIDLVCIWQFFFILSLLKCWWWWKVLASYFLCQLNQRVVTGPPFPPSSVPPHIPLSLPQPEQQHAADGSWNDAAGLGLSASGAERHHAGKPAPCSVTPTSSSSILSFFCLLCMLPFQAKLLIKWDKQIV